MGAIRSLILALAGAGVLAAPAAASEDDWPVLKGARLEGLRPWGAFAVYRADRSVTGVSAQSPSTAVDVVKVDAPLSSHGSFRRSPG